MEVLKRVAWSHKFTCKGCKSVLKAEASDVRLGEFGACMGDRGEMRYYVACVVCKDNHLIADSKVPTDVQNGAARDK